MVALTEQVEQYRLTPLEYADISRANLAQLDETRRILAADEDFPLEGGASEYAPVIIHSTERQQYYEALRAEPNEMAALVHTAISAVCGAAIPPRRPGPCTRRCYTLPAPELSSPTPRRT